MVYKAFHCLLAVTKLLTKAVLTINSPCMTDGNNKVCTTAIQSRLHRNEVSVILSNILPHLYVESVWFFLFSCTAGDCDESMSNNSSEMTLSYITIFFYYYCFIWFFFFLHVYVNAVDFLSLIWKQAPQSGISTADERNDRELREITVSEPLLCQNHKFRVSPEGRCLL